jgi:hypothetical protein
VVFSFTIIGSYVGIFNLMGNFEDDLIDQWIGVTGLALLEDLIIYQTFKAILTIILKLIFRRLSSSDSACEAVITLLIDLFMIA